MLMVRTERERMVVHFGTSNSFQPPRPDECVANALFLVTARNGMPELLDELSRAKQLLRGMVDASVRMTDEGGFSRVRQDAEAFLSERTS